MEVVEVAQIPSNGSRRLEEGVSRALTSQAAQFSQAATHQQRGALPFASPLVSNSLVSEGDGCRNPQRRLTFTGVMGSKHSGNRFVNDEQKQSGDPGVQQNIEYL